MKDTLFIVDLDGVTFDSTERFKRATKDGKIDWSIAFNPELLKLDTLIEGAQEAIDQLSARGDIVYLTSRPDSLHHASEDRLEEFNLLNDLICKPDSKKYTKTIVWKADMVKQLVSEGYYKNYVFIDDEENNRFQVMKLALGNVDCYESLDQALEAIGGQDA